MSFDLFFNSIQSFAAFITSITIIGGALIWFYQKTIGKKKEREIERRSKEYIETLRPIKESLELINKSLEERESHDRKLDEIAMQNQEILAKHDERLDNHNDRLIVVETILDINGRPVKKYYASKNKESE